MPKRKERKILNIYIGLHDETFEIPSYLEGKPFVISICPTSIINERLSGDAIEKIVKLLNKNCILSQKGYRGICRYSHDDGTDPYHENLCSNWFNQQISPDDQIIRMKKGSSRLERVFDASPLIYSPPNHLWDEGTLRAIEILDYQYMFDKNLFALSVYKRQNVIIIPETPITADLAKNFNTNAVYINNCEMDDPAHKEIIQEYLEDVELVLPSEIKVHKVSRESQTLNELKKRGEVISNDFDRLTH